jgi:hypothetical protein
MAGTGATCTLPREVGVNRYMSPEEGVEPGSERVDNRLLMAVSSAQRSDNRMRIRLFAIDEKRVVEVEVADISTIFMPLTFIVGIYGMNFSDLYPSQDNPYGFHLVLVVSAVIAVVMLVFFRRRRWI